MSNGKSPDLSVTTLEVGAPVVTLINVFEVAPERADALIELLDRATVEVMRHLPGFVSANIHRGTDGAHVANYAQWRSVQDFQRMLQNPDAQVHMREASRLAQATPILYALHSVHR